MKNTVWVVLLCAALGGCVTSRAWDAPTAQVMQDKVKAGDDITIVATNGKTYRMQVTSLTEDALYGEHRNGKRYKVMYSMIDSIHVRRGHAWPAIPIVGGAVLVGAVAAVLENLGDQNWDLCGGN